MDPKRVEASGIFFTKGPHQAASLGSTDKESLLMSAKLSCGSLIKLSMATRFAGGRADRSGVAAVGGYGVAGATR